MNLLLEKIIDSKKYKFYDYDAEKPYKPGEFNKNFKTQINDKVKEMPHMTLDAVLANSFLNGEYTTVKTTNDFYLYRIFGEYKCKNGEVKGAKVNGAFATTEFAESRIEVKIRLALDPQWMGTKMYEAKIHIPKGVILNIGIVAPIKTGGNITFDGGAEQILLPRNWSTKWIVGYRRVTISQLHQEPTYSSQKLFTQNDKLSLYPKSCPICSSTQIKTLSESERIEYSGSNGGKYMARYNCLACHLYW